MPDHPSPRSVLATVGLLLVFTGGCASGQRSSLAELGVPVLAPPPGLAAVALGWEDEAREGWSIDRLVVDGRTRPEWDEGTQRPIALYLVPGRRTLHLFTAQRAGRRGPQSQRRFRSRPQELDLEPTTRLLCLVRLEGMRRRPRLRCSPTDRPRQEGARGSTRAEAEVAAGPPEAVVAGSPPAPAELAEYVDDEGGSPEEGVSDLVRSPYEAPSTLSERVHRLEGRLEQVEALLRQLPQDPAGATEGVEPHR